ncbi:MAG: cytochrome c-550 PedF [Ahrensia sp.]|nr:cytochrome c-550 PedF [Ahrensia sp.]
MTKSKFMLCAVSVAVLLSIATLGKVGAHGDVAPQAVDISGLPTLGEEWLEENPWRDPEGEYWKRAIEVGSSGYNSNCARCHGLGAVSGGLAPDLRYLSADIDGDEWYVERYINGYTQGGITKMPAFGELLGQEAAWAIRTYLETRPDTDMLADHTPALTDIRDKLTALAGEQKTVSELEADVASLKASMEDIASKIESASGAPVADSVASKAAAELDGSDGSVARAAETLKVGLSAAK